MPRDNARMLAAFYDCVRGLVHQAEEFDFDTIHTSTLTRLLENFEPYRREVD
jgi:hypothetical protein